MTLVNRNTNYFPTLWGDLFDSDFLRKPTEAQAGLSVPAVNIKETADHFMIEMAAAGMKKDDFKIAIERNTIKISSEKQEEQTEENTEENYTRREFSYTSFSRSFVVPEIADLNEVKASYQNGVLKVEIGKKAEAKMISKNILVE